MTRVTVGSKIPSIPHRLETLDDHVTALMERLQEAEADLPDKKVRVIFVSYADPSKPLQRMWIEEWNRKYCSSPLAQIVLDPTKSSYQAFDIPSSLAKGWGFNNLWYYTKAIASGRQRSVGLQGEAGQMGADFVLAPNGTCLLAYYCKDPTDRVAVDRIVEALRSYQK